MLAQGLLDAFFKPRAIAFVGASDDPARISGRPLAYTLRDGFAGGVYPVNPRRETVQGVRAYSSLAAIDDPALDLAVIAIPSDEAIVAVGEAAERGVKAAVILSSGFAEIGADGIARQKAMLDAAARGGMRLLGPNSLGLFSSGNGVAATFTSVLEEGAVHSGSLAIVSQSGAYGAHLAMLALKRGVGLSRFVTTGNEADLTLADCIAYLADDPEVGVIGCYSEGLTNGRAFLAAAERARIAGKPIVMMKVGRSESGRQAAQSHTASVAGDDAVFAALAKDAGIARVDTTQEFVDLLYTLSRKPPVPGPRLGILTVSGGAGVLMADASAAAGFILPPMPEEAQAEFKAKIPFGSAINPVDTTAQAMNDLGLVEHATRTMLDDGGYDAVAGFFMNWPDSPALGPALRQAIARALAGQQGKTVAVAMNAGQDTVAAFDEAGMLVFEDPSHAIAALGASRRMGEALAAPAVVPEAVAAAAALPDGGLDEAQAAALLAAAGVPMIPMIAADDPAAAGAAATTVDGPVALKILSPDIAHKSDIGGVRLNLSGPATVRAAATEIEASCRAAAPDAELRGFVVSPMAPAGGIELLLGGRIDPVFGPVVAVGLGGVFVEIFHDVRIMAAPLGPTAARAALQSLKGWPLLAGARGRPPADIDAAAAAIAAFSRFLAAHASQVTSVEVNPLLVLPDGNGVLGLDAVIERAAPIPRRD